MSLFLLLGTASAPSMEAIESLKAVEISKTIEAAVPAAEAPVETQHEIKIGTKTLSYKVTTGMLPIKSDTGETEANIFFMAYTLNGAERKRRPLMFSFNGGPGSSSVWLHLGALGPKRVRMGSEGEMPAPPYSLMDNPQTWLEETDLVFIDPVGTGFSRPVKPELGKKFWSVDGDIESIGEFIRLYLTRYERWTSPLFLVGESYGTTRAAGLSGHLVEKGIALNGIVLISSVLNFQTLDEDTGNDLPYQLFLPTYTATAWYHKKLSPTLQKKSLRVILKEVESWVTSEYTVALAKGDALTKEERSAIVEKLSRYTGLTPAFIENCNLRISQPRFCKELLRERRRNVGRLDSRFLGIDALAAGSSPDFDPSMTAIRPPYTALLNDYLRTSLNFKTDEPYHILGGGIKSPWAWNKENGYVDTSSALQSAFSKNPFMKLFVASGFYDLATPYFATEYTLNHSNLDISFRSQIRMAEYEAGHMMYIQIKSLEKLKQDVSAFIHSSILGR